MSGLSRDRTVLAALSGGVDSSVAALLLKEQGYSVVGVFLRNGVRAPAGGSRPHQGCCSESDAADAARVADKLDIPFHALDMQAEFRQIQDRFRREYAAGRTPNPCALCNRDIKFGALLGFADAFGAGFVATGHYARLERGPGGLELWRGADRRKDQSYVLFPAGPEALARTLLPVGGLEKQRTRALAAKAGLPVFAKPDSQEICFVPTGDYRDVLRQTGGLGRAGRFVDRTGRILGEHDGFMGFTRGQRRGLGIAHTEALYVLDVDPVSGDVLVGPRRETGIRAARVEDCGFFGCSMEPGERWAEVEVQYRSSPGGVPGSALCTAPGVLEVEFPRLAESVTPGQALAFYRNGRLLAGGWIARAEVPGTARLPV